MRGDEGHDAEECLPSTLLRWAGFHLSSGLVPLGFWARVKSRTSLLKAPAPWCIGKTQWHGKDQNCPVCTGFHLSFQSVTILSPP